MNEALGLFERFSRRAHELHHAAVDLGEPEHPFDARNVHFGLPNVVRSLFDSAHYSQATFEAFKFLEQEVKRHGKSGLIGKSLMMKMFSEDQPTIAINQLVTETHKVEQEGYKFLFSGGILAIRNPRGHDHVVDDIDTCLDHITFASMLLRRLAAAGFHVR